MHKCACFIVHIAHDKPVICKGCTGIGKLYPLVVEIHHITFSGYWGTTVAACGVSGLGVSFIANPEFTRGRNANRRSEFNFVPIADHRGVYYLTVNDCGRSCCTGSSPELDGVCAVCFVRYETNFGNGIALIGTQVVSIEAVSNVKYCVAAGSDCVADFIRVTPCDPITCDGFVPSEGDVHAYYAGLQVHGRIEIADIDACSAECHCVGYTGKVIGDGDGSGVCTFCCGCVDGCEFKRLTCGEVCRKRGQGIKAHHCTANCDSVDGERSCAFVRDGEFLACGLSNSYFAKVMAGRCDCEDGSSGCFHFYFNGACGF